jgi:hypothetical protein
MGEPAVDVGSGVQQIIDGEAAEDNKQQHAPGNVVTPVHVILRSRFILGSIQPTPSVSDVPTRMGWFF